LGLSGVGRSEIRIECDGLPEVVERAAQPRLTAALFAMKAAVDVQLVGVRVLGVVRQCRLLAAKLRYQRGSHPSGDRVLHREDVGERLVVTARPKLPAARDIEKPRRNPQALGVTLYVALEHRRDFQLASRE